MPYLQLGESQFPLRVGEMGVGSAPGAAIRIPGSGQGLEALLQTTPDGAVVIRRARPDSLVRVNGVQLGLEPAPLLHGDKLEIGGHELFFGDERRSGGTHYLTERPHGSSEGHRSSPGAPTSATGGRLISLVDGREYPVPKEGLTLGRDPGCDVVIPAGESSRRHARVTVSPHGYEVHDTSTNGVFVNGDRIDRSRALGRGDVIRIATEEFRFYADVPAPEVAGSVAADPPEIDVQVAAALAASRPPATPAAPPPASPVPPASPAPPPSQSRPASPAPPASPPPSAPSPAFAPSSASAAQRPVAPSPSVPPAGVPSPSVPTPGDRADARPVLATLEILNEGVRKGTRFEVRTPLAHIGRGEHNDIVLHDESVSETHAKLQRRGGGWVLVDLNSTNGTYVAGKRVHGDIVVEGARDLRFGGVKLAFSSALDVPLSAGGTRAITGVSVDQIRQVENSPHTLQSRGSSSNTGERARPAGAEGEGDRKARRTGVPVFIWILALALGALALIFVWQGRS